MEHHFEVEHAIEFGIEEAIVIYNFRFWLLQNKANNRNIKKIEIDGKKVERYFTYNSAKALSELFPYLNPKKIYRVMESLETQEVLIKKYFNSNTYNRTSWYCFKDQDRFLKTVNAITENEISNSRKREMEIPKTGNHDTDNKPDNNANNKQEPLSFMNLKSRFAEKLKILNIEYIPSKKEYYSIVTMQELSIEPTEILSLIDILIQVKRENPNDRFLQGICYTMSDLVSYRSKIYNARKKVVEFKRPEPQPKKQSQEIDMAKMLGVI